MIHFLANIEIVPVIYSMLIAFGICVVGFSIIRLADSIESVLNIHEEWKLKELAAKEMENRLSSMIVSSTNYIEKVENQIAGMNGILRDKRQNMLRNKPFSMQLTYLVTDRPIPNTQPFRYWVRLDKRNDDPHPSWYRESWVNGREYVVWSATSIGAATRLLSTIGKLGVTFKAI